MYEKLKEYLHEWVIYKAAAKSESLQLRIAQYELISIARAVKLTITEMMMEADSEFAKVTPEDQKIIDEVFDFLELRALKKD